MLVADVAGGVYDDVSEEFAFVPLTAGEGALSLIPDTDEGELVVRRDLTRRPGREKAERFEFLNFLRFFFTLCLKGRDVLLRESSVFADL